MLRGLQLRNPLCWFNFSIFGSRLDLSFFRFFLLLLDQLQVAQRESLVGERERVLELGVGREAHTEALQELDVVGFRRLAARAVRRDTEPPDVAQADPLAFLHGVDDLFLQGGEHGQAVVACDGTSGTDAGGQVVDADFLHVHDVGVELGFSALAARVLAFDEFVIHAFCF